MSIEEYPYILTTKDVMEILNISRPLCYRMMDSEGFPIIRVGTTRRVRRDKFIEWLENQEEKNAS